MPRPDGTIQEGQTADCQIDNLDDISEALGNVPNGRYYSTKNGYTMAHDLGLEVTLDQSDSQHLPIHALA